MLGDGLFALLQAGAQRFRCDALPQTGLLKLHKKEEHRKEKALQRFGDSTRPFFYQNSVQFCVLAERKMSCTKFF